LVGVLTAREHAGRPMEEVEGLVVRWVEHLEARTGLLLEQRTGFFGFFHLSLLEYLAARAMERVAGEDLVGAVVSRWQDEARREVCLLLVGVRATDHAFLEALCEGLEEQGDQDRWPFLLACLREEAAYGGERREAILDGAGTWVWAHRPLLFALGRAGWRSTSDFAQIRRFSVRHAQAATDWLRRRLQRGRDAQIRAAVALDGALREGLSDPDRPDLAACFRERFGLDDDGTDRQPE